MKISTTVISVAPSDFKCVEYIQGAQVMQTVSYNPGINRHVSATAISIKSARAV